MRTKEIEKLVDLELDLDHDPNVGGLRYIEKMLLDMKVDTKDAIEDAKDVISKLQLLDIKLSYVLDYMKGHSEPPED